MEAKGIRRKNVALLTPLRAGDTSKTNTSITSQWRNRVEIIRNELSQRMISENTFWGPVGPSGIHPPFKRYLWHYVLWGIVDYRCYAPTQPPKNRPLSELQVLPRQRQQCFCNRVLAETNFEPQKHDFLRAFRSLKTCYDKSILPALLQKLVGDFKIIRREFGGKFGGNSAGFFSDPQSRVSKISGTISEHFS